MLASATAPIALFVYNRPWHARQTVEALRRNELAAESDLIVFCDAAGAPAATADVAEVRQFVRSITGFRSVRIVERATNLGLANSIIDGVSEICRIFGRVIVLEDDLITAPSFLRFMNEALDMYVDDGIVGSIHGYWYPTTQVLPDSFFLRGASCWGWATWGRAWQLFEPDGRKLLTALKRQKLCRLFDLGGAMPYTRMLKDQIAGKNNSWAIRWHATMFLAGCLQLSPGRSLVRNIGFDGSGVHCSISDDFYVDLAADSIMVTRSLPQESQMARAELVRYYRNTRRGLFERVIGRFRRMVSG